MGVADIGIVSTPILRYYIHYLKLDSSTQIEESHNPHEDNGFKINFGTGAVCGKEIQNITRLVETFKKDYDVIDVDGAL